MAMPRMCFMSYRNSHGAMGTATFHVKLMRCEFRLIATLGLLLDALLKEDFEHGSSVVGIEVDDPGPAFICSLMSDVCDLDGNEKSYSGD